MGCANSTERHKPSKKHQTKSTRKKQKTSKVSKQHKRAKPSARLIPKKVRQQSSPAIETDDSGLKGVTLLTSPKVENIIIAQQDTEQKVTKAFAQEKPTGSTKPLPKEESPKTSKNRKPKDVSQPTHSNDNKIVNRIETDQKDATPISRSKEKHSTTPLSNKESVVITKDNKQRTMTPLSLSSSFISTELSSLSSSVPFVHHPFKRDSPVTSVTPTDPIVTYSDQNSIPIDLPESLSQTLTPNTPGIEPTPKDKKLSKRKHKHRRKSKSRKDGSPIANSIDTADCVKAVTKPVEAMVWGIELDIRSQESEMFSINHSNSSPSDSTPIVQSIEVVKYDRAVGEPVFGMVWGIELDSPSQESDMISFKQCSTSPSLSFSSESLLPNADTLPFVPDAQADDSVTVQTAPSPTVSFEEMSSDVEESDDYSSPSFVSEPSPQSEPLARLESLPRPSTEEKARSPKNKLSIGQFKRARLSTRSSQRRNDHEEQVTPSPSKDGWDGAVFELDALDTLEWRLITNADKPDFSDTENSIEDEENPRNVVDIESNDTTDENDLNDSNWENSFPTTPLKTDRSASTQHSQEAPPTGSILRNRDAVHQPITISPILFSFGKTPTLTQKETEWSDMMFGNKPKRGLSKLPTIISASEAAALREAQQQRLQEAMEANADEQKRKETVQLTESSRLNLSSSPQTLQRDKRRTSEHIVVINADPSQDATHSHSRTSLVTRGNKGSVDMRSILSRAMHHVQHRDVNDREDDDERERASPRTILTRIPLAQIRIINRTEPSNVSSQ